jgi:hypothetical protein
LFEGGPHDADKFAVEGFGEDGVVEADGGAAAVVDVTELVDGLAYSRSRSCRPMAVRASYPGPAKSIM